MITKSMHGAHLRTPKCQPSQTLPYDVELVFEPQPSAEEPKNRAIWSLIDQGARYQTEYYITHHNNSYRLYVNCEGKGYFQYQDNQITVAWQETGTGYQHYLQTIGLALWLELQGVLCLHANAITLNGKTALLMAPSQTGKSTLTTAMLDLGAQLLCDDMAAIHSAPQMTQYSVYPSNTQVRLWPDTIKNCLPPESSGFNKVHQRFAKRTVPVEEIVPEEAEKGFGVDVVYLLERQDEAITPDATSNCHIDNVEVKSALISYMQNGILGSAYRALEIESQRLAALATFAEKVPAKRLRYRSGYNHLHDVANALAQDMQHLASSI